MGGCLSRHEHAVALDPSDPHSLSARFVTMQRQDMDRALRELESGAKRFHMMLQNDNSSNIHLNSCKSRTTSDCAAIYSFTFALRSNWIWYVFPTVIYSFS